MSKRADRLKKKMRQAGRNKLRQVRQLLGCSGERTAGKGEEDDIENLAGRPHTTCAAAAANTGTDTGVRTGQGPGRVVNCPMDNNSNINTSNTSNTTTITTRHQRSIDNINDEKKELNQDTAMRAIPDNDMMGGFASDRKTLGKEHSRHSSMADVSNALAELKIGQNGEPVRSAVTQIERPIVEDPEVVKEREQNLFFIHEAIEMARLALRTNETPVGCVLVHNGRIIAKGMNATNVTRNGTRHAELMAISSLLSVPSPKGERTTSLRPKNLLPKPRPAPRNAGDAEEVLSDTASSESRPPDEGNEDGRKGHLYPYGQKLHPDDVVDPQILRECVLYVTVEPCVMCASLLRQLHIKKVYFGAVNDKFGGTGGVFSIHANSLPVDADGQTASAHPIPRQHPQLPDSTGTLGMSYPPGGGDGGNVEPGFEIEGGWGRDEAVGLLRRFYVQENGRAPVPRKKEGRAARLAALMEQDGDPATVAHTCEPSPIFAPNGEASSQTTVEQTKENMPLNGHYDLLSFSPDNRHKTGGRDDYMDIADEKAVRHERPMAADSVW